MEKEEKQVEQELEKETQCPECGNKFDTDEFDLRECFVCGWPEYNGYE